MNANDLLLVSIGSAASGVVKRMASRGAFTMRSLLLDTDDGVWEGFTPTESVAVSVFGTRRLAGHGTGGDRNLGASALRDDLASILSQIGTPRMVIVLVCCGGGTSGAVLDLVDALRKNGIVSVVFATTPFSFEGSDRHHNAAELLRGLRSSADALAQIPLDSLLDEETRQSAEEVAFERVAEKLSAGFGLFQSLLEHPAFLPFDAGRFMQTLLRSPVGSLFCFADATASGEGRAEAVLAELDASPRFHHEGVDYLTNADVVIVGVLAGEDLRLCELDTIMRRIRERCSHTKEILLGTARSSGREGALSVVVLAFSTGHATTGDAHAGDILSAPGKKGGKRTRETILGVAPDCFSGVEATIYNGENLDIPTYQRRKIRLNR